MNKQDVKEFKKYVTEEVLQGVRKNGTIAELDPETAKKCIVNVGSVITAL